jgi:T5SS/PEP-CTERM-associated repeat protein
MDHASSVSHPWFAGMPAVAVPRDEPDGRRGPNHLTHPTAKSPMHSSTRTTVRTSTPLRRGFQPLAGSIAALLLAAGFAVPDSARAIDYQWNNAGTGIWFTGGNWTPGGPPGPVDNAFINNGGTSQINAAGATATDVTVGSTATGTLQILAGSTLSSSFVTLGQDAGSNGTLLVTGAGAVLTNSSSVTVGDSGQGGLTLLAGGAINGSASYIGGGVGGVGTATVTGGGSTWANTASFTVGTSGGDGTLNILLGGTVSDTSASIGVVGATSVGVVTVNGAGSTWNHSDLLAIGVQGTGTLNIQAGGAVTNTVGIIGEIAGGNGTVIVDGTGGVATWTNSSTLTVGQFGTGALTIQAGGAVSNTTGTIGRIMGSSGTVTVTGTGSMWTNSADLKVGDSGGGTLNILLGGTVSNTGAIVGVNTGAVGAVTVNGMGSTWTNSSDLIVGQAGDGTLTIQAGGAVSNVQGSVGSAIGGVGTATVDGTDSTWTNSGSLTIGGVGSGQLTISNGGVVTDTDGIMGVATTTGNGTVSVTGVGSMWTNSGDLNVGYGGMGFLVIQSEGKVTATAGLVGAFAGSNGTALVSGTGALWSNSSTLKIGNGGTGELTISNGGAVTNTDGTIGSVGSGSGTVLVSDATSTWTNSGILIIGDAGSGNLTIQGGGAVSSSLSYIGKEASGDGTVLVSGPGSTWAINGNSLIVGSSGTAHLTIENGGAVSDSSGDIGASPGGSGTVLVTGAGSTWTNGGELIVGNLSTGSLTIQAGGAVTDTTGTIGKELGSNGTVVVDGAGSTWTNDGQLTVGNFSTGSLTIQAGGAVSNTIGSIGEEVGSNGTVMVDGAGSTWMNSSTLRVGNSGTGHLTIQNGGAVSNTGFASIGSAAGSNGTVLVTGPGSKWTNASGVVVGGDGTGHLTIQAGGTVSNTDTGYIGEVAGSNGTVLVDGAGSTWTNGNLLYVGFGGTGLLTIQNGGAVSNTSAGQLGNSGIGTGTVLVTGPGSTWTNGDNLDVGFSATGLLTIQNGGAVSNTLGRIGTLAGGSGTVIVDGAGSVWTNSTGLSVGSNGTALLTIQGGGQVNVNGGAGTASLAVGPGSTGTLNIGSGGAAGILNAATVTGGAGTAVVNFNHTDAGYTFSPVIAGSIAVKQIGTGTTILPNANTYTGGTTVNAGTFAAGNAKAFSSGNLTMTGGTLRTTGGPLAVNIGAGNILFTGGTYIANVGGTSAGVTHDQLKTTGSANINGATLALVQQNGFTLTPGQQVVLVSAAGGVAGSSANGTADPNVTGASAFSNTPLLVPVVNLYPTSVTLEVTQGSFAALSGSLGGFTPNQLSVATALDSVSSKLGGKTGVFSEINFLDTQSLTTLTGNLDKISPDELTAIFTIAVSLANIQTTHIQGRTAAIRDEAGNGGGSGAGGVTGGGGAPGPTGKRSKEIRPADNERWGMWFTGAGEFTHVGSTTNAAGFNTETGGVTAGVDYRFTDHFAAGISLGYMNTNASLVNGGKVDVDGGRVGLYATYFDRGFYLDAAVSGGFNSYDTRRITPNNTAATGKPDGAEINTLLAAGYDWKFGGLTIGPTASFQYTNVQLDGFTENGTFAPLSIAGKNAESLRTALGFRATFDAKVGGVIIRPEARAAWQHEYGDTTYSLTSSFATLGGSAFTVYGPTVGRDSLLVGAGFTVLWSDRFSTYAFYDGELLRTNYSSHNVSAGFRYRF